MPALLSLSCEQQSIPTFLLLSVLIEPVTAKEAVKPIQPVEVQTPMPKQELVRTVSSVNGCSHPCWVVNSRSLLFLIKLIPLLKNSISAASFLVHPRVSSEQQTWRLGLQQMMAVLHLFAPHTMIFLLSSQVRALWRELRCFISAGTQTETVTAKISSSYWETG